MITTAPSPPIEISSSSRLIIISLIFEPFPDTIDDGADDDNTTRDEWSRGRDNDESVAARRGALENGKEASSSDVANKRMHSGRE